MPTIALLGTLDTKGDEFGFLAEEVRRIGHTPLLVDAGTGGECRIEPDIGRYELAAAAGIELGPLIARGDRGECVSAMSRAAAVWAERAYRERRFEAIVSLGGGGGTAIGSAAMRALPIGVPKLMVSTVAGTNTAPYVGTKDVVMMPSVVDICGLNRLSRTILAQAAAAICGMATVKPPEAGDRPLIAASMFGNTTQCIEAARGQLEEAGYEVLVFHATGTGGRTMESLIESGMVAGVFDITTTELADELAGGVLSAGPDRMNAAARAGVPAVVAPGCLDMVNFGEPPTIPPKYQGRNFYIHNPQVTLMRTDAQECRRLGEMLAEKVNAYTAPVTVLLPRGGVSVISAVGGPFHDPRADETLFEAIKQTLRPEVPVVELDCTINDPAFAKAAAEALLANIAAAAAR